MVWVGKSLIQQVFEASMRNYIIGMLHSQNGIQRDGTFYFSKSYIDGQWVRFHENVPKKIGGCLTTDLGDQDIVRSLYVVSQTNGILLYMGRAPVRAGLPYAPGNVQFIPIDISGNTTAAVDRTPVVDFIPNINYVWNFDVGSFTSYLPPAGPAVSPANLIFANPIINDISSTEEGNIYAGLINVAGNPDITPLNPVYYTDGTPVRASGGILFCAPVLVAYGNDGKIIWSRNDNTFSAANPGTWPLTNNLTVTNTKIVHAANTRGGGSPTILLWSLTSLCKATFVQTAAAPEGTFVSNVVQDNISIISANSVVNYEQQFFWIGTDQFYVYNGIVQTLPNTMNNDWFFNNINLKQRSKIFGVAVPRYKEIWWFYPRGTSNENNACVIYSVALNIWYDNTINPLSPFNVYPFTRAAGVSATGNYPFPIFSDNTLVDNPNNPGSFSYPIWTHEQGVDRVVENQHFAINSYFTTHLIDLWSQDGTNSNLLNNWRVATDFLQSGQMTLTVNTQMYPQSKITSYGPYIFNNDTEFIDLNSQGGLCSFTFTSNVVGGNYQAGKSLYFYEKGDTLK